MLSNFQLSKIGILKVGIAHSGECKKKGPTCMIPCTKMLNPICGTDGKTHGSPCLLRVKNCMAGTNVGIAHAGECRKAKPKCEPCFDEHDDEVLDPVCGTDGKTHWSICELRYTNCMAGTNVGIAHAGECRKAEPSCGLCPELYDPVCGTDGKTHATMCTLRSKNCEKGTNVKVLHSGRCKAPKSQECPKSCSIDFKFVCGSDGTTYVNRCIMQKMNDE